MAAKSNKRRVMAWPRIGAQWQRRHGGGRRSVRASAAYQARMAASSEK